MSQYLVQIYSPKEPRCQKLTIFTVCNPNLLLVSANFKHWVSIFWGSNGRKIKHCEAEAKSVMLIKKTRVYFRFSLNWQFELKNFLLDFKNDDECLEHLGRNDAK